MLSAQYISPAPCCCLLRLTQEDAEHAAHCCVDCKGEEVGPHRHQQQHRHRIPALEPQDGRDAAVVAHDKHGDQRCTHHRVDVHLGVHSDARRHCLLWLFPGAGPCTSLVRCNGCYVQFLLRYKVVRCYRVHAGCSAHELAAGDAATEVSVNVQKLHLIIACCCSSTSCSEVLLHMPMLRLWRELAA
jgi:hypothetical protein